MNIDLRQGDCLEVLKTIPDNSIDSVVTDPPYHLTSIVKRFGKEGSAPAQFGTDGAFARASKGFMGKEWDGGDIAFRTDVWSECLRVLKPGGHLLAFGGSRTYHRLAVAVEDAGFEIRDQIMWVYGSGFPKSHNIGKAIDKFGGNNLLVKEIGIALKKARTDRGLTLKQADELFCNGTTNYNWLEGRKDGQRIPNQELFDKIVDEWTELKELRDKVVSSERELLGVEITNKTVMQKIGDTNISGEYERTKGNSEWEGWGTALKPAHEPIVMARKPLSEKSVAENVLKWGTGGINIDGCRIETDDNLSGGVYSNGDLISNPNNITGVRKKLNKEDYQQPEGRFPANIMFDEEAGKLLDQQSGVSKSTPSKGHHRKGNTVGDERTSKGAGLYGDGNWIEGSKHNDSGGASRFFYCPKVSKKERNAGLEGLPEKNRPGQTDKGNYSSSVYCKDCGKTFNGTNDHTNCEDGVEYRPSTTTTKNHHPTVKPIKLMEYLIKLVTPKGGITLDPFMGSGSTGVAAVINGFKFLGIEREQEYMDIAKQRITQPVQTKLDI